MKQMDNAGYQRDVEKGAALEMKTKTTSKSNKDKSKDSQANGNKNNNKTDTETTGLSTSKNTTNSTSAPSTSCRPGVCQAARRRYAPPDLTGSPWHRYKTIFLLLTLVLLAVWIIIYATLNSLHLL